MKIVAPFARPLFVMAKPAGSLCNLRCKYCYYIGKDRFYADEPPHDRYTMSDSTLRAYIQQYVEAQTQPQVLFTWHGGEPLLRPMGFYRRVLELQRPYVERGYIIDNSLQTNGTLLNDEWCAFFREHNWLIGISIDGPQELHDAYRRAGQRLQASPSQDGEPSLHMLQGEESAPSFLRVMRGIRLLQKHGVEWNAMGVVNNVNADHPLDVYHFYKEIGCQYIQFTPIVESADPLHPQAGQLTDSSVRPGQFARFLCAIFNEWVRSDVGRVFVQMFDSTLACWAGEPPGLCSMWPVCGHAGVMAHNGDVYSCDHFVFPDYLLGNVHRDTIASMMFSARQQQFGRDKHERLPRQCRECPWLFACNGGCPKDRLCRTADGEDGLNYLCQDYRQYFSHVAPYMDFMYNELLHQRPPANVMNSRLAMGDGGDGSSVQNVSDGL